MSIQRIVLITTFLLGLYGLYQWWDQQRSPAFKTQLLAIDTAAVSQVMLNPADGEEFQLLRVGADWFVTSESVNTRANARAVRRLLAALAELHSERLAAQSPRAWAQFGVDDGQGVRIDIWVNDQLAEQFILGISPATDALPPDSLVYLRLLGQNEVFGVPAGNLRQLPRQLHHFRNRGLVQLPNQPLLGVRWWGPDTLLMTPTDSGQWVRSDLQPPLPGWENYLQQLKDCQGDVFADDFDELQAAPLFYRRLSLLFANLDSITIDCYRDTLRALPYVLHSSQFPDNWLASDSLGLYQRVFKWWEQ